MTSIRKAKKEKKKAIRLENFGKGIRFRKRLHMVYQIKCHHTRVYEWYSRNTDDTFSVLIDTKSKRWRRDYEDYCEMVRQEYNKEILLSMCNKGVLSYGKIL